MTSPSPQAHSAIRIVTGIAFQPGVVRRSLWVSLIVGTLLTAINQGDLLLIGSGFSPFKAFLTYLVPYCVATYGAVTALMTERP